MNVDPSFLLFSSPIDGNLQISDPKWHFVQYIFLSPLLTYKSIIVVSDILQDVLADVLLISAAVVYPLVDALRL